MRPLRAIVSYLIWVFLGGALLSPGLYWVAQSLAGQWPALQSLAHQDFHRYVSRALLVLALIGLWPLLRSFGARSLADLGFQRGENIFCRVAKGLVIGFGSLAIAAILALACGARSMNSGLTPGQIARALLTAVVSAIVVGVLEEILFRGGIFGALRKSMNWEAALGISSAIYALVHFFAKPANFSEVHWNSGFIALARMSAGFTDVHALLPGFFNLLLAGALAVAYQRTGTLYFSIGLHAGWIFWLKAYGVCTAATPGANVWFWGTEKLIDGWLALPVLLVAAVFVLRQTDAKYRPGE